MFWAIPSFHGDIRLTVSGAGCQLEVVYPTPQERNVLAEFGTKAAKKGWLDEDALATWVSAQVHDDHELHPRSFFEILAPIKKVGALLSRLAKPSKATLTAVRFADGKVEVTETHQSGLEKLMDKAMPEPAGVEEPCAGCSHAHGDHRCAIADCTCNNYQPKAAPPAPKAAATVSRPTPSCPSCELGSVKPASDVLLSFLDEKQHEDWAKHRAIMVVGGKSGHKYILAHRNSPLAVRFGKICYDATDGAVMHFHDPFVPPEEEVLAAMLMLQHREDWLRNEATCILSWSLPSGAVMQTVSPDFIQAITDPVGAKQAIRFPFTDIYKNPFGDYTDGTLDANIAKEYGRMLGAENKKQIDADILLHECTDGDIPAWVS